MRLREGRVFHDVAEGDLEALAIVAKAVIITRPCQPAGVLIGCETQEDWFAHRQERDARFLQRAAAARQSPRAGSGMRLEEIAAG